MNGIADAVRMALDTGTPAAFGGYAATPYDEARLLAQRYNPFRYLLTGQDQMPENGYSTGGIAGLTDTAASFANLLSMLAGEKREPMGSAGQEGGAGPANGGSSSGNRPGSESGANYGGTAFGKDGFSPGKDAFGLGPVGNFAVGKVAGMAIPGAGALLGVANGFNAGARSAQFADAIGQLGGKPPSLGLGSFIGGALGIGATKDTDFGIAAMAHGLTPDQAQTAVDNYGATANINMRAEDAPGFGIAGTAGAAASGVSSTGLNVGPSAAAFGQGFTDPVGAVGNDGVGSIGGATPGGFGGMSADGVNSSSEGSQGGTGANGAGGGGSGGSQGGGGANGGGGDNGGGWARGGRVGRSAHLSRKFAAGSGLVPGMSGGREDQVSIDAPQGSFVVPADVVSGLGQGNTEAGAMALKGIMPADAGRRFAVGGIAGDVPIVPIQVSSGEFVVHPAHVSALGGPDVLDRMIAGVRQVNAQVAQGMPAPR